METRICELFGIEHPIVQAGIGATGGTVRNAELAAAVSNAGGLGQIGHPSSQHGSEDEPPVEEHVETVVGKVREAIDIALDRTDAPLAVNCRASPTEFQPDAPHVIEAVIEERGRHPDGDQLTALFTSAGPPSCFGLNDDIRDAGLLHFHAGGSVRHAEKIETEGLDGVVATGYEGGGHISKEEDGVHTFVLVPAVAEAVDVPVLAAGGCTDGRSLAGALALGADGVYMGTRFVAAAENAVHEDFKGAVVGARETDTRVINGFYGPVRVIENEAARRIDSLTGADRLRYEHGASARAQYEGDTEEGALWSGMGAGRIHSVETVQEIVDGTVEEAEAIVGDLQKLV